MKYFWFFFGEYLLWLKPFILINYAFRALFLLYSTFFFIFKVYQDDLLQDDMLKKAVAAYKGKCWKKIGN